MKDTNELYSNRIEYLDVAKGLGIMLIILGHTDLPVCLKSWIFSFHVPLFLIVSGYCFKQRSLKHILNKGWRQLLRPFLITHVICFVGLFFLCYVRLWDRSHLLNWFLNVVFITRYGTGRGLWFLGGLLWAKIWLTLLLKFNRICTVIFLIALFLIAWLLNSSYDKMPWYIPQGMACTMFLAFGYFLRCFNIIEQCSYKGILLLCFIIICFGNLMYINVFNFIYGFGLFSVIGTMCISFSVLVLLKELCQISSLLLIRRFFLYVGTNTLLILCIHSIIHTWQLQTHIPYLHPYSIGFVEFVGIVLFTTVVNKFGLIQKYFHP